MFKKLKEVAVGFIGDLAYFFGSVMAEGFEDRMQQIAEEEQTKLDEAEAEEEKKGLPDMGMN